MNVSTVERPLAEIEADALILPYPAEPDGPGPWADLDAVLGGVVAAGLSRPSFKGKVDQVVALPTYGDAPFPEVFLTGLGDAEEHTGPAFLEIWRRAAARACVQARDRGARSVTVALPSTGDRSQAELAVAAAEAAVLACYRYRAYMEPSDDDSDLEEVFLATGDSTAAGAVRQALVVADAASWARDLVNTPGNAKRPPRLAATALEMAEEVGLEHEHLDPDRCRELGLEALLAVGGGSGPDGAPRLLVLQHRPGGTDEPPVVLVGKGVTFDSGGISIKPSKGMEAMKGDMAGAAAVLGTLRAVAELDLPLHVVGVTPLAENLPSATSYRPGDIVRAHGDKSIEVVNTDAEGRLILADALSYAAQRFEPACMVDLATLTGACVVALGTAAAGLMSEDDELASALLEAGEQTGERLWRLPLWGDYDKLIDSDVAAVKNSGGRDAGAITAGKFLQRFVGDTPWAHLDIAGPAFLDKAGPYTPKGGSGFGVRLLSRWLRSRDTA